MTKPKQIFLVNEHRASSELGRNLIKLVLQNMQQVKQSATELFSASKEVSGASLTLSGIASDLQRQVTRFK